MLETRRFFVANWKMYKTFKESIAWWENFAPALATLAQDADIIVCPTFPALDAVKHCLGSSGVKLGAQSCSWKPEGSLTGDVSVASLQELGCSYCIVGHSERRRFCGETNEQITQKLLLLANAGIIPILCIGESEKGLSKARREQVLADQLSVLRASKALDCSICIAYEPVWAIGTGDVPSVEHIQDVVTFIGEFCQELEHDFQIHIQSHILYGGSVDPISAQSLWQVAGLEGFLIGGASVDFQSFQKIVQSHR